MIGARANMLLLFKIIFDTTDCLLCWQTSFDIVTGDPDVDQC